jgi:hypothetical protein
VYDKYTYDVSSLAQRVETVPGALAAKTVTFGTTAETGANAATGTPTSNNTNVSDADTVTIGSAVYTFKSALTEAYATGTLTSNNTQVSANDTVTLGSIMYKFVSSLTGAANEVLIGAAADDSLTNLASAINGTTGAGTTYGTGTVANTAASSTATPSSHILTFTALTLGTAGNSVALAKSAATLTVSHATLQGGVNSVADEVFIDSSADASLTNLQSAINGTTGAGTKYSTATTANTQVTCGAVASHAVIVTAITAGEAGNAIATTKSAATLSWGNTTLTGGTDNLSLFTVTGDVLYAVIGVCTTSLAGASAQLEGGFTGNLTAALPLITATNLTANKIWDSTGIITAGTAPAITPVRAVSGQTIKLTELTAEVTSGAVHFYCIYQPLSSGATVSAV